MDIENIQSFKIHIITTIAIAKDNDKSIELTTKNLHKITIKPNEIETDSNYILLKHKRKNYTIEYKDIINLKLKNVTKVKRISPDYFYLELNKNYTFDNGEKIVIFDRKFLRVGDYET